MVSESSKFPAVGFFGAGFAGAVAGEGCSIAGLGTVAVPGRSWVLYRLDLFGDLTLAEGN